MKHYILKDGKVIAADLQTWGKWFEDSPERFVEQTTIGTPEGDVFVSTVFLGIDHNFSGSGPALLFETMAFRQSEPCTGSGRYRESMDQFTRRHATLGKAKTYHAQVLQEIGEVWRAGS